MNHLLNQHAISHFWGSIFEFFLIVYVVEGAEIIAVIFFGEFRKRLKFYKILTNTPFVMPYDCLSFFPNIYNFFLLLR